MTSGLEPYFQDAWDSGDFTDQHELRDAAFKLIKPQDYEEALYEALLNDAYAFMLAQRDKRPSADATTASTTTASAPPQQTAGKPSGRSRPASTANSAKSSKFAQARKRWPMLQGSYSVAYGFRKNLESMSADEVLAAASIHRKQGEGTIRRAEWLERLAEQMIKLSAATPMKLPPNVLDEFQEAA